MGAGIQQTIQRSLIAPLAAFAGAAGVRALVGFADTFTRMENTMKVAGVQGEQLTGTMESLFEIATKHSAPVEALATLYGRLALSQKELNISSEEMIKFTDNVGAALRVSGRSAAESSGALLQLSQALGSGVVRSEEFNSVLEGAQPILQAVANGLEEAGGSIAKLRQLVIDGKVSSEAFFRAFMAGGDALQEQASQAEKTVGQAIENIRTAFIKAIGSVDNLTGASEALGAALGEVATQIRLAAEQLAEFHRAGSNIVGFFQAIDDAIRKTGRDWGLADALDAELVDAKMRLADYQAFRRQAEASGNQQAIEDYKRTFGELERQLIATINALDPGPAFEKAGREGGKAFSEGFRQGTISLAGVATAAVSGPVIHGGLSTRTQSVPGAGGTVPVNVTRPVRVEPAGISTGVASGVRDFRASVDGFNRDLRGSVDGLNRDFRGSIDGVVREVSTSGDKVVTAISQQTNTLSSTLREGLRTIGELGRTPGAAGGTREGGGGTGTFNANPAVPNLAAAVQQWSRDSSFTEILRFLTTFAAGGAVPIRGPGGPTDDKIPVWVSNGEAIINAAMTRKHMGLLRAINEDRLPKLRMADGGMVGRVNATAQGFANGGVVRASSPMMSVKGRGDINVQMTVIANDAQSFRTSQRDMIRQMSREIRSADV